MSGISRGNARPVFIEASLFATAKKSGVAYAVTNIIHSLALADPDRKIVLLTTTDTTTLPAKLIVLPNVENRKLPVSSRVVRLLSRLPSLMPIDVFLGRGTYIFTNFYNLSVPFSRSITFVHDIAFMSHPETVQSKNLKYLTNNIRKWVRRSTLVATLSEASKQEIEEELGLESARVIVVHVPLGEEFSPARKDEIARVKKKYKVPQKYILYLGNIEPRKNLARLVEAFAMSRTAKAGLSLLLVGADKWKASEIEGAIENARAAGCSVIFPAEYVTDADLPALISGAEFLVQPSLHEGFGVPPTQALACGTAVVVSDLPVMHEVLGLAADYFDPLAVGDICAKIDGQFFASKDGPSGVAKAAAREQALWMLQPQNAVKGLEEATV